MTIDLHRFSPALAGAWDRASTRERRMLVAAILVVVAALGWSLLWQPIAADLARLERDVPREQAILAAARAQSDAIAALERAPRAMRSADARTVVERVLVERDLRQAVGTLDAQDGGVRITFPAVRFDDLVSTLDALARQDALRAVAVTLTGRVEPGMVRAELTLVR